MLTAQSHITAASETVLDAPYPAICASRAHERRHGSSAQRPQASTLQGLFADINRERTDLIELLEATTRASCLGLDTDRRLGCVSLSPRLSVATWKRRAPGCIRGGVLGLECRGTTVEPWVTHGGTRKPMKIVVFAPVAA